jgi:energy-coupling factor transporter ATP-binding protein EcfA2
MDKRASNNSESAVQNFKSLGEKNHIDWLRSAIQNRQTILVIGSTGSGKSLLFNALALEAAELFPHEEIAVFRDTAEGISTDRPNLTCHTGLRYLTPELRQSSKGLFIDGLLDDLRGDELAGFIRAFNTGHFGAIAVYGASVDEGINQLRSQADSARADDCIDVIVLMERTAQGPRVQDIQMTEQASLASRSKLVGEKKTDVAAPATMLSDAGPSWCTFLPDVERWAAEFAVLARADMKGLISASVWPYRINGSSGEVYLSVDMAGAEGGHVCITFGVVDGKSTQYDFGNLAGNTCFMVPDLTEAFCMTAALLEKLDAVVTLPTRR